MTGYGTGDYGVGDYGIGEERDLWFHAESWGEGLPPQVGLHLSSDTGTLSDIVIRRGPDVVLHDLPPGINAASLSDYEAPYGVQVTYYVTATHSTAGPVSASSTVVLGASYAWLIHPIRSLSICVDKGRWDDEWINVDRTSAQSADRPARISRFDPPSRTRAVIFRAGPRMAASWTLVLLTTTLAARDAVDAILTDQSPLLLRSPASFHYDLPDGWYQAGDVQVERATSAMWSPLRKITIPLTPCQRPPEAVGDRWTWQDLEDEFASWDQVEATFESWTELELGGYS